MPYSRYSKRTGSFYDNDKKMARGPFRGIDKLVKKAGRGAGKVVKKVGRLFKRKKKQNTGN